MTYFLTIALIVSLSLNVVCVGLFVYWYKTNKATKRENDLISQSNKDLGRNITGLAEHEVSADKIKADVQVKKEEVQNADSEKVDAMFDAVIAHNNDKLSNNKKN